LLAFNPSGSDDGSVGVREKRYVYGMYPNPYNRNPRCFGLCIIAGLIASAVGAATGYVVAKEARKGRSFPETLSSYEHPYFAR
jgi:hypothetical protein